MQFGICTPVENSAAVKAAGWDFVEERVDQLLQGLVPDAEWNGAARASKSVLPIIAANVLVPQVLKIVGPEANLDRLSDYLKVVVRRAAGIGIQTLVFGSGGARTVPDGFDRAKARQQIVDFLKVLGSLAQKNGITIAMEHLNHGECNIINSVEEAMTYVHELNHPAIQCLVDSYHFWLNGEMLESVEIAMPSIMHVHISDKDRSPPGSSGKDDYRPLFAVLKRAGYDGPVCVEAVWPDVAGTAGKVLEFVKKQWKSC